MNKLQLSATSLVAALPAGYLCFVLAMAFLSGAEKLSSTLMGIIAFTLLCAGLLVFMPLGIILFGGKKKAATLDQKSSLGAASQVTQRSEALDDDDLADVADGDEYMQTSEFEAVPTDDNLAEYEEDFGSEDSLESDDADFDQQETFGDEETFSDDNLESMDDFTDEISTEDEDFFMEEEPPKKKKKK